MSTEESGVAIVVPFLEHLGGTESLAWSLAERFASEGIPALVLTCAHLRESRKGTPAREGVMVHAMPVLQRAPLLDLSWVAPGSLALWRRRRGFKALIAYHLPTAGVLAALAARLTGKPFAVVTQGSGPTGDVTALRTLPWARARVAAVNRASFVAAINGVAERELLEAGVRETLIRRIPSACDTDAFRPAGEHEREQARERFAVRPDELAIVFTGRLHPDKQLPTLLAALTLLGAQRPARLLVTGEGPERDRLQQLASEQGIADRVSFLGRLDDQRPVLHAADVFCLPSVSEGISVALLEAMACGLAVVVSDIAANREVVGEERDGLVAPCGDEQAWQRALARLAADRELRSRLGAAARRTVEERFRKREIEGRYVDWFRSV